MGRQRQGRLRGMERDEDAYIDRGGKGRPDKRLNIYSIEADKDGSAPLLVLAERVVAA